MNLISIYKKDLDEILNFDFVDAIIIFGSENKIKNNNSDLDICVITQKKISKNQRDSILFFNDKKLDVNLFEDLNIVIKFKVFSEGKIYRTKINLCNLKNKTINEWFDFRPILNNIYVKKGLLPII